LLTSLAGLLKQRRLVAPVQPSINLLLTSYGWHNVYTHGDPSLITALQAGGDPTVRVYTPADCVRAGVALDDALRSTGRLNVILAGKHIPSTHPLATLADERHRGFAVWPHLGAADDIDLCLICVGDLPTACAPGVVAALDQQGHRTRVIAIYEMTALASPELRESLAASAPILVVTLGHPAAIWGLFAGKVRQPTTVVGWREPPRPMTQRAFAEHTELTVEGLTSAALRLLRGTTG
jgi:xylulose-5-phosphate/fructose-6-phosphate phosphoketolase